MIPGDRFIQIRWSGLGGYKGLEFMQIFRKFVLTFRIRHARSIRFFKMQIRSWSEFFQKYHLQEKNTVILSPYSNTLADLPDKFWGKVAEALKDRGFVVCTNSCGRYRTGSDGDNSRIFSLDIAPQLIEKAGYFIGIRSGFCDIISGSAAKEGYSVSCTGNDFFNGSTF